MNRTIDRRAVFFLIAGVLCLLTLVITPAEYFWVGYLLGATYFVLAGASFLDHRSGGRRPR